MDQDQRTRQGLLVLDRSRRRPPAIREKGQTPYNICLIELQDQEGLRIVSNVLSTAPEDIHIDMPVKVAFMPTADDPEVVLPLFVPA